MHTALILLGLWALAFVTLCLAVLLLAVFWSLIGQDLDLHTVGKEAGVASAAALVEALGLWLISHFAPKAGMAILFPAVVVALIYKTSHAEDWHRFEIICLLLFQSVLAATGATLVLGHFATAACLLLILLASLGVTAAVLRNW